MKTTVFFLIFSIQFAWSNECLKNRAVFDIGSGTTKLTVARVDSCKNIIEKIFFKKTAKVSYAADLEGKKVFSEEIIKEGEKALKDLQGEFLDSISKVDNDDGIEWHGFATSAFRRAENGKEVLAKFENELEVKLDLIKQDIEGQMGFLAGSSSRRSDVNEKEIIVWDIGGGSQQFSFLDKEGKIQSKKIENAGAEKFKQTVLQVKAAPSEVKSPNAIGDENVMSSIELAREFAKTVEMPFKPRQIIGIGGVHSSAVPTVTGKKENYARKDLYFGVYPMLLMTDKAINDKYADTMASNMLLIIGMMWELNFNEITISSNGTTEGALLYGPFWK